MFYVKMQTDSGMQDISPSHLEKKLSIQPPCPILDPPLGNSMCISKLHG